MNVRKRSSRSYARGRWGDFWGRVGLAWLGGRPERGLAVRRGGRTVASAQVAPASGARQFGAGRRAKAGAGSGERMTRSGRSTALTNESRAAALALATRGEVFDLGMTYSRRSYKWPGHSPGEIITFRSPDGVASDERRRRAAGRQESATMSTGTRRHCSSPTTWPPRSTAWLTSRRASTSTGTTASRSRTGAATGARASATRSTIPPIIARGVLIDVAAFKNVDALPGHTVISRKDLARHAGLGGRESRAGRRRAGAHRHRPLLGR